TGPMLDLRHLRPVEGRPEGSHLLVAPGSGRSTGRLPQRPARLFRPGLRADQPGAPGRCRWLHLLSKALRLSGPDRSDRFRVQPPGELRGTGAAAPEYRPHGDPADGRRGGRGSFAGHVPGAHLAGTGKPVLPLSPLVRPAPPFGTVPTGFDPEPPRKDPQG